MNTGKKLRLTLVDLVIFVIVIASVVYLYYRVNHALAYSW
ncbi:uncharacterized protein METZ01_LOCUS238760, partial [marine metagenome]